MKILHFNDIANVSSTLVEASKSHGIYSEIYRIPLGNYKKTSILRKIALFINRLKEIRKLKKYFKENHFSVLHIHYAYFGILGILTRIPYYLHCHGTDIRGNLKHPIFKWITLLSLKKAKKVYFSTPDLGEEVLRIRKDAKFIPNPINMNMFFLDTNRSNEKQLHSKTKVLVISKLDPTKGIEIAIETINQLAARSDIEFTMFNFGVDHIKYLNLLQNREKIKFIDKVPYSEIPKLISEHDIVIGQLKLGAIGMSELEALAVGRPVICKFDYDGFYDEISPFIKVNNSEKLLEAITYLADNPDIRKEIGVQSRIWVEKNHDYKKVFEKLYNDYLC
ncbi:glycosyltransferase family 4 protein [Tepidibacillus fermentans]|uniref:glycosyltransferase family 4 protein n=1 Tax=Tepidibacillus fermentans TaxID=1281767 RepID=UPI001A9D149F|nr:glycosyltransferase family 4 protein [Tepidibacillus fermentans]